MAWHGIFNFEGRIQPFKMFDFRDEAISALVGVFAGYLAVRVMRMTALVVGIILVVLDVLRSVCNLNINLEWLLPDGPLCLPNLSEWHVGSTKWWGQLGFWGGLLIGGSNA